MSCDDSGRVLLDSNGPAFEYILDHLRGNDPDGLLLEGLDLEMKALILHDANFFNLASLCRLFGGFKGGVLLLFDEMVVLAKWYAELFPEMKTSYNEYSNENDTHGDVIRMAGLPDEDPSDWNSSLWTLSYQSSRDGKHPEDFHEKCDGKGPTFTVVLTADGSVIGGFNPERGRVGVAGVWLVKPSRFLFGIVVGSRR